MNLRVAKDACWVDVLSDRVSLNNEWVLQDNINFASEILKAVFIYVVFIKLDHTAVWLTET